LLNYHDAHLEFPVGTIFEDGSIRAGANTSILPYLELQTLYALYDPNISWRDARHREIAATPIPTLDCPSTSEENPKTWEPLVGIIDITTFGTTDYGFSKGPNDAYCLRSPLDPSPGAMPTEQRGMFDVNWHVSMKRITDGSSNTFAMGEASGSDHWHVCRGAGCDTAVADSSGEVPSAWMGWIIPEPNNTAAKNAGLLVAGTYGCTADPMNKFPVTDTFVELTALYFPPGCPASWDGGSHSVSNFRSDHPGGCNFLYADSSVHYLSDGIDDLTYRAMSTIQGEEVVAGP